MPNSQVHEVEFRYSSSGELQKLMDLMELENQYHSGRYRVDYLNNYVEVYTCPNPIVGSEPEQRLIGHFTIIKHCWEDCLNDGYIAILVETGFSMDDMLRELGILELRAFGVVKQGKVATSSG